MERSGGCRSLLRGEGLSDAQPSEGEFHGGHGGAEPLGGVAFLLRNRLPGFTLAASRGYVLGGVGGCGGCGGHMGARDLLEGWIECPAAQTGGARVGKSHWLVKVLKAYNGRSVTELTVEPLASQSRNQGTKISDEL